MQQLINILPPKRNNIGFFPSFLKAKKALVDNKDSFLILSDEQTEGRGRFNRYWSSSKGKGLWMSLVLRPNVPFSLIPKFNLFIALGIRDAIQHFSKDRV